MGLSLLLLVVVCVIGSQSEFPGAGWGGSIVGVGWGTVAGGVLACGHGSSCCPVHTLSCPDSKLQEELQALRETFSNLTASTDAKVKTLSMQGEEGWGLVGGCWDQKATAGY